MIHEWACCDEAANYQLPIATAFWAIWIISAEECSSLMENLMLMCCSTHSVILNVTATQYTCSLEGTYLTHWLVQWSRHSLFMHACSSPLSGCQVTSMPCKHSWIVSGQTSYIVKVYNYNGICVYIITLNLHNVICQLHLKLGTKWKNPLIMCWRYLCVVC